MKELFDGRSQLLVYHFMFGPDYKAGCPSCSMIADGFDGFAVHLANHDVDADGGVARAARKAARLPGAHGLVVPLGFVAGRSISTSTSTFPSRRRRKPRARSNTITRAASHAMDMTPIPPPVQQFAATCGVDGATYRRDRPGMSAFVLEDGIVYHAYSTYARGLDGLWGAYQWLDRAPKGRNEQGIWWRRHDEYGRA